MCVPNQNYLMDALDQVLSWDVSDALLPYLIIDQAKLLAGFDSEDDWQDSLAH